MRNQVIFCAALCAAAFSAVPTFAQERKLEDVQKEIVTKFEKITTLKANYSLFSERDTEKYLFKSTGTGSLEYGLKDGKQLLHMSESRTMETEFKEKDKVVIGGKNLQGMIAAEYLVDGDHAYTIMDQRGAKSVMRHPIDGPDLPRFGRLLFDNLARTHEVTLLPDETHGPDQVYVISAKVKERRKDSPLAATRYYFRKSDGVLVKSTNHQDDDIKFSTTTYTEIQIDVPIPPERFKLNVPPGTPISDQPQPGGMAPTVGGARPTSQPGAGPSGMSPLAPGGAPSQPPASQPASQPGGK